MKRQMLQMCLMATLLGAGQAWSQPPPPPPPPELEAHRAAVEAELAAVEAEVDAQAKHLESSSGRLSQDQLFSLLQSRESRQARFDPTPVVLCTVFFSCVLTGFLAWLWAADRKARRIHETVRLVVEKGAEIPPGLLTPPRNEPSDLRRGIILSASGLGLALFLAMIPGEEGAWGAGAMLLFIGLGHVLVWRLRNGKGPWATALSPEPRS
ncbi:DUF6249 domain-containing protein [Archangium primigenium]|uniref:DUF6249 domain-containing protein n=1 Tax=[Archangium] primigenium TaxID=2792470 RepID=UPI00195E003D|nr:DUF6249 domain-containing protein [Archangium primigenium]MBM7113693.1 hypothetical protein [Archangium primigenium]